MTHTLPPASSTLLVGLRWLFALLVAGSFFSSAQAATGIYQTYAIVNAGAGNGYRAGGINSDNASSFINFNYGTYTNSNTLVLNGGQIKTFKSGTGDVTGAHLHYRVYLQGSTPGAFTDLNLGFDFDQGGGNQIWQTNNANINLLNSGAAAGGANNLTVRGRYVIEAYWRITSNEGDKLDGSNTTPYRAYFDFDPSTFTGVTQSPVNGQVPYGDAVTVTATLSAAAGSGQYVYLRYTKDNFATCTIVPMTNSTGTQYTTTIPNLTSGTDNPAVTYYAFTSTSATALACGDESATLRYGNNGGGNYGYAYGVDFTTVTQNPAAGGSISSNTSVTVTANFVATPSAGEYVYLRYHVGTGSFANGDPVLAMSKSGQTATATIPAQSAQVTYYAFTSPNAGVTAANLASATTLKFGSNGGANYTYTPYAISVTLANGGPICAGQSTVIRGTLAGTGPWTLYYTTNNANPQSFTTSNATYSRSVGTLNVTTDYQLTDVVDANGNHPAGLPLSTTVVVNPRPLASVTSSTANCAGTPATVQFSFTGTGPWSFTYSDGTSSTVVSNINTATYTITPTLVATTAFSVTQLSDANCSATAADLTSALVTVPVTSSIAWQGNSSDWNDVANWSSSCIPTPFIDATIPAGASVYPVLTAGNTYSVKRLTLDNGGELTQTAGTLDVYGDVVNNSGANLRLTTPLGVAPITGGTLRIRGAGPHSLSSVPNVFNLVINTGAASNTTSTTSLQVFGSVTLTQGTLSTNPNILRLRSNNPPSTVSTATISETESSYVIGQVAAVIDLSVAGVTNNVNGLGLRLTPAAGSTVPGQTNVLRTTGENLGTGSNQSIQRWFRLAPAVETGLNMTLAMDYFNHENNVSITDANAILFSSPTPNTGNPTGPWEAYNSSAQTTPDSGYPKAVGISGLTHLSDWTIGSSVAPLPVKLISFDAIQQQNAVALRWATASEHNSKGFDVQVSTDGQEFRTLGFVASAAANTTTRQQYSYLDRSTGTAGVRYYRLRQLDLDGTVSFSPVRTVLLGEAGAVQLAVVPNPFASDFTLLVQTPAAQPQAVLTVTDVLGRVQHQQVLAVPAGSSEARVAQLAALPAGLYVVRLQLGTQTHYVKVTKN